MADGSLDNHAPLGPGRRALEVALIVVIFFVFAGTPPPAANEAHYLAKAKHYWNPDWCSRDVFLDSADAHQVFYWLIGWLTLYLPLAGVAWVGRILVWGSLAWSWHQLSTALSGRRWVAVLSAALMVVLTQNLHMAGEWIVGGVEAKGFAFALIFLALANLVHRRWRTAVVLLGAATAFHVLLGGWSLVALAVAWICDPARPRLLRMIPSAALAGALALPGIIPALALDASATAEAAARAQQIYVFERLSHHLVLHHMNPSFVVRHVVLWIVFGFLFWRLWSAPDCRRMGWFSWAAAGIALIGVMLEIGLGNQRQPAAAILRFYWYRLADAIGPVSVALLLPVWWQRWEGRRSVVAACGWTAAVAMLAWYATSAVIQHRQDFRPAAVAQSRKATPQRRAREARQFLQWRQICAWIHDNTERDAVFWTPRRQQTFHWYAGRAELANWKNIPQDAEGIVDWYQRIQDLYPHHVLRGGLWAHSPSELRRLARKYQADYLLLERRGIPRRMTWTQVYPVVDDGSSPYVLYRVPRDDQ